MEHKTITFFDGTLQDLLSEEYGGEEVFGEEVVIVELLLGCDACDIIFTTTDEDFESVDKIVSDLIKLKPFRVVSGYSYYNYKGVKLVYNYVEGGLVTLFINKVDKDFL